MGFLAVGEKGQVDNSGQFGLLSHATVLYDAWVARGEPIRDVGRGWVMKD